MFRQIVYTFRIWSLHISYALDLNIVVMLPLDPPTATALAQTGAALDIAVEDANLRHTSHNLSVNVHHIQELVSQTCAMAGFNSARLLAEYYYRKEANDSFCTTVLATACNDLPNTFSLAREYGWLVFSNGITPANLISSNYPTAFYLGGSPQGVARPVLLFLAKHHWHHLSILFDTSTPNPLYAILGAGFSAAARSFRSYSFELERIEFDGSNQTSIAAALDLAQSRSRVFVVLSFVSVLLKLLDEAVARGMDNGEYVFVNVQLIQLIPYGTASMLDNPSPKLINITRSLFFAIYRETTLGTDILNARIADAAKIQYNVTYRRQPLYSFAVQSTYSLVDIAAQTVIASAAVNEKNPCDVSRLLKLARNRTYTTDLGQIAVGQDRAKRWDVDILAFNAASSKMEKHAFYNATADEIDLTSSFSVSWVQGHAPPDEPQCGFGGTAGFCLKRDILAIAVSVTAVVGGVVVCALAVSVYRMRRRNRCQTASVRLISKSELYGQSSAPRSSSSRQSMALKWNGVSVWIDAIPFSGSVPLRHLESRVKGHPTHPNICAFYGLCQQTDKILLVSEFCRRGCLSNLEETMLGDLEFKLSLVENLVQGTSFLHKFVGPHGNLRPTRCLIDNYFTLKIGKTSYDTVFECITGSRPTRPPSALKWTAPEISNLEGTTTGDVYSVGLLIKYILSGRDQRSPVSKASNLSIMSQRHLSRIQSCLNADPAKRPAISQIKEIVRNLAANSLLGKRSPVEYLYAKMSKYAATLETAVDLRTTELLLERQKCDELLAQLLPEFVAAELRMHSSFHPEEYESVSICFCQADDFAQRAAHLSHMETLEMITRIHDMLQRLVETFDVLKIDAANDCSLVASGIPKNPSFNHALELCKMASAHRDLIRNSGFVIPHSAFLWGIHTGPCAAGVVGRKVPRYLLFGDTVNVASRMMSHGQSGAIHISSATAVYLAGISSVQYVRRGSVSLKGRGNLVTFWLERADTVDGSRGLPQF